MHPSDCEVMEIHELWEEFGELMFKKLPRVKGFTIGLKGKQMFWHLSQVNAGGKYKAWPQDGQDVVGPARYFNPTQIVKIHNRTDEELIRDGYCPHCLQGDCTSDHK